MKLSRTVTYALKATLQLAQDTKGGPVPCSRLAAQGAMPERFLLQILRSLVTHGILKSTRGVDGGYVLLREANEVSLLDVIEAIEGPLTHEVSIGEGLPPTSQQKLASVLDEVTQTTLDKLSSVMLADLISTPEEMAHMRAQMAAKAAAEANAAQTQPSTPTPQPNHGVTTRIDVPTPVSQTPIAAPAFNPNPPAGPGMTAPSPATNPSPTNAAPNVIGTPNPLQNINPSSGSSV